MLINLKLKDFKIIMLISHLHLNAKNFILTIGFILLAFSLGGCAQTASWHADDVAGSKENQLTIGNVQRSIEEGMSGAQVAQVLGSPNVVSTDENGNEVWIYDRFSTEEVVSGSSGNTFFLKSIGAGASRKSQTSTTIIIKFNEDKKVNDIAYHKSSF